MIKDYLPISKEDMEKRGWEQCDFVYVIGDAYVDHHSFGPAIISRVLESNGYKVGIISQPDWKNSESITMLGTPRLGFLVSGGNMDTMVNHYTVAKKRRAQDAYSPGGEMGKRPDRATIVYCNLIRKVYKNMPIIIGGIEASLRRLGHYDYWSDSVKRSILLDSQADLISYGMGERSIVEIAEALDSGLAVRDITFINGTVYKAKDLSSVYDATTLPTFDNILKNKEEFAKSFYIQYTNTDPYSGKRLVEQYKDNEYVVQNPPSKPLSQGEMDRVYALPFMRDFHPSYIEKGGIPAIEELKFSLTSNRGCFGGCNFCALTFHQGRIIQTRSHESIIAEANHLIWDKDFKGYINDVGGPTANFRHVACEKQNTKGACLNKQCLFPTPCKNLKIDHSDYLSLLRKLRELPNVKKVFVRSGIRFDYLISDQDNTFMKELCEHHISGQLKVAPEHISDRVLDMMGKPKNAVYEEFLRKYHKTNEKLGKNQFVVPYLMSSHPGSSLKEAVALAEYLRDLGYMPEQVQDFYPTPSTISTCMYYTGLDPRNMQPIYVPKTPHEKAMQRALIQYRNPKNYDLVVEALTLAGRTDLIGYDKKCLIRPKYQGYGKGSSESRQDGKSDNKNSRSRIENKNSKENRNSKEDRNSKENKYSKENKNSTENRKSIENKNSTENRKSIENKNSRKNRYSKENRSSKDNININNKENKNYTGKTFNNAENITGVKSKRDTRNGSKEDLSAGNSRDMKLKTGRNSGYTKSSNKVISTTDSRKSGNTSRSEYGENTRSTKNATGNKSTVTAKTYGNNKTKVDNRNSSKTNGKSNKRTVKR